MVISVTRLKLRSIRFLPAFLWNNRFVLQSITKAPGFRRGKTLVDAGQVYWTMTVWNDVASMRSFRSSGAHAQAMPKLANWASESAFVHWESERDQLPEWQEAHRRLTEKGRPSPLKKPSKEHNERRFREPRWASWRERPVQRPQ
jgi:heme-degrading monooxygenase HmoA